MVECWEDQSGRRPLTGVETHEEVREGFGKRRRRAMTKKIQERKMRIFITQVNGMMSNLPPHSAAGHHHSHLDCKHTGTFAYALRGILVGRSSDQFIFCLSAHMHVGNLHPGSSCSLSLLYFLVSSRSRPPLHCFSADTTGLLFV